MRKRKIDSFKKIPTAIVLWNTHYINFKKSRWSITIATLWKIIINRVLVAKISEIRLNTISVIRFVSI